uniref:Uncharacterized protein n=1 Tax=Anguilla anguilla TaxID=7936 RepID=A0A0E9PX45_ANGAN
MYKCTGPQPHKGLLVFIFTLNPSNRCVIHQTKRGKPSVVGCANISSSVKC